MQEVRILVVDDNVMDARLCQLLLDRHAFTVTSTTDPMTALEFLQAQRVDLLLVDIYLPLIDGFELIKRAKTYQPNMAVLVMTGFATIETGIQALQRGVDGLILKPFENGERLIEAVRQALLQNRHKEDSARLHVLRPLFSVTEGLISETNPINLYRHIIDAAENLFQDSFFCVYRTIEGRDELIRLAASDGVEECTNPDIVHSLYVMSGTKGAFFINDESPEYLEWRTISKCHSNWSFMAAPVRRDKTYFLFIAGRSENALQFSESDLEMFVLLARQAAVAIINADLYEELRTTLIRVEESQRALVQAEKMAVIGRLVASVAHEINNPLQGIGNCLHLARHPELDASQRDAYLKMGKDELDRLTTTVKHMLDYYRLDTDVREPVDIKVLVERVLDLLNSQLSGNKIRVHIDMRHPLPPLAMEKNQMQQVILNLMLNAIDAVLPTEESRAIWIDAFIENNSMYFSIEDNGSGVPDEFKNQIFEPFFSTKPDGMGLGLMVTYGIVEAHGGTINLAPSRYGKGARFLINLPYGV
jgi:signal transduction histidine kinase/CheY-like chemotaxis protein